MTKTLDLLYTGSDYPEVLISQVEIADTGTNEYVIGSQGQSKEIVMKDSAGNVVRRKTLFYGNVIYPTQITKIINSNA